MQVELKEIHIGNAIAERLREVEMSKGEFAQKAGIPQQHVYRVFERDTIEVKKLIRICKALDFNFFALFCEFKNNINAFLSAINFGTNGKSQTILTKDAAMAASLFFSDMKSKDADEKISIYNQMSSRIDAQLADKDAVIRVKDEQIGMLKAEIARLKEQLENQSK
jgi:DNA-binding Xre family transcriptional regulator